MKYLLTFVAAVCVAVPVAAWVGPLLNPPQAPTENPGGPNKPPPSPNPEVEKLKQELGALTDRVNKQEVGLVARTGRADEYQTRLDQVAAGGAKLRTDLQGQLDTLLSGATATKEALDMMAASQQIVCGDWKFAHIDSDKSGVLLDPATKSGSKQDSRWVRFTFPENRFLEPPQVIVGLTCLSHHHPSLRVETRNVTKTAFELRVNLLDNSTNWHHVEVNWVAFPKQLTTKVEGRVMGDKKVKSGQ